MYEENLHGLHAAVLLKALTDESAGAATNIALAGHYGSGKSSVIRGVQAGLDEQKINWVNLSLSSLGIDETKRARIQQDGTHAPLTNLIQKEIVKQLPYRKAPADMPGSRYFRIDSFRPWPAAIWGAAVAVGFLAVAVLFGLVTRVRKMGPQVRTRSSMTAGRYQPAAAEEIQRRQEEIGFSYFVFGADVAGALAPVVAELAGR
jgi:hypothetical protein